MRRYADVGLCADLSIGALTATRSYCKIWLKILHFSAFICQFGDIDNSVRIMV